jgi:hypothetical protein
LNLTITAYNLFGDTNDNVRLLFGLFVLPFLTHCCEQATAYIFYAAHGTYLEQQYSMLDTVISWANTRLWLLEVDLVASLHYLEKLIIASPLPPMPPKRLPIESGSRLLQQHARR